MRDGLKKPLTESRTEILASSNDLTKKSCVGSIPARYVLTILLFCGCFFIYGLRVNLNIAIVDMVNTSGDSDGVNVTTVFEESCPSPTANDSSSDLNSPSDSKKAYKSGMFSWSLSDQALVLGGFYYGYAATQFIGGRLSERFGPKATFCGGVFMSSLLTVLTPVTAEWNFVALIILRVVLGIFQGITFPALYTFLPVWYPVKEISTNLSIIMVGNLIGTIVSMLVSGYLCEHGFAGGWPSVFYVFGSAGLLFSVVLLVFVHSSPQDHPRISSEELKLITENSIDNKASRGNTKPDVPWLKIFTSVPVWALTLSKLTVAYGFHVMLTRTPAYLAGVLNFPIESNGSINAIMYLCQSITGVSAGVISDQIIKREIMSRNHTRKVFVSITLFGSAAALASIPLLGCDALLVIVLLSAALGLMGFNTAGDASVPTEMAPPFSGTIFGLTNTLASCTGFIAPLVVGKLLETNPGGLTEWSYVFYSSAGVCVTGAFIFLTFGSAKLQPWANFEVLQEKQ